LRNDDIANVILLAIVALLPSYFPALPSANSTHPRRSETYSLVFACQRSLWFGLEIQCICWPIPTDRKDAMKAKIFYGSPRVPRARNTLGARMLLPVLLITLSLLVSGSIADAHGDGYYQIRGAVVAPYVIHAWVAPGVLRTGDVHIDTAVMDSEGNPAMNTLVQVALVPLENEAQPMVSLAGAPDPEYPYARGASFRLETPGMYRLEIGVSDAGGMSGKISQEVEVTTIGMGVKSAILIIFLGSALTGVWLLWQTRIFWHRQATIRASKFQRLRFKHLEMRNISQRGVSFMKDFGTEIPQRKATFGEKLNRQWHAPALWIYMLIIVAHWLEHVLQIYQIYGLGWHPDKAGGILGVIYPSLVESETLHFVYDFIQWAGILVLLPGFRGRARTWWIVAMVAQTWHYIEHVLLMGQYLSGYYLFGAAKQISILQLWFPRAELHFSYNLMVFIPMVIAVHYYLQPKIALLAAQSMANNATPKVNTENVDVPDNRGDGG
jgi:hypothetical protein